MAQLPPLPDSLIFLVEAGSTAHGTGLPGHEDRDEVGVYVEGLEEVFGLVPSRRALVLRTAPEGARSWPGDIDRTLYTLRHFLALAAAGNPSVLMCLWAPVVSITPLGEDLRALAPAFVGRHIVARYRGYMRAQAERLAGRTGHSGHGVRGSGARPELVAEHGWDTKFAMHCARLGFQGVELLKTGRLTLPMAGEPGEWLRSVRRGEVGADEWAARCASLDTELARLGGDKRLPAGPDRERIVAWSAEAHRQAWGWVP